jgi:hypothetical protein
MRNNAIYLATFLCVPAAALIVTAPIAAANDTDSSPAVIAVNTGSSPAATADNTDTFLGCFPANEVRTAAQAGDVKSACSP